LQEIVTKGGSVQSIDALEHQEYIALNSLAQNLMRTAAGGTHTAVDADQWNVLKEVFVEKKKEKPATKTKRRKGVGERVDEGEGSSVGVRGGLGEGEGIGTDESSIGVVVVEELTKLRDSFQRWVVRLEQEVQEFGANRFSHVKKVEVFHLPLFKEVLQREADLRQASSIRDVVGAEMVLHALVIQCKQFLRQLMSEEGAGSWLDIFSFMNSGDVKYRHDFTIA
jgi:hypothetical protein